MDQAPTDKPLQRPRIVLLGVALLVLAYFLVPLESDRSLVWRVLTFAATLTVLAVLGLREMRRGEDDPVGRLVLLLVLVVVFFSATFTVLSDQPGQFSGMHTRLDALYFTVVMMATIGFGDIHPTGQLARGTVLVAIIFQLLVVTTLASALVHRIRSRRSGGHGARE